MLLYCALYLYLYFCFVGSYFVPRINLEPPESLICEIFKEADELDKAIKGGASAHIAAQSFVELMLWGRKVLLQDLPMMNLPPDCDIMQIHPFNTEEYKAWAEDMRSFCETEESLSEDKLIKRVSMNIY